MSQPTKIGVLGITGRMGQRVQAALEKSPADRVEWVKVPHRSYVYSGCDGVIDFSMPAAVLEAIEQTDPRVVWAVGSTGFRSHEFEHLQKLAKNRLILKASNFSMGVAILRYSLAEVAPLMKRFGFTSALIETHHIHKKDSPSGTALTLAGALREGGVEPEILALRQGEVIGEHEVRFFGHNEELRFEHSAKHRDLFAEGALETVLQMVSLKRSEPSLVGLWEMDTFVRRLLQG